MDYSLTKKLLRDWKHITRSGTNDYKKKYILKPHETNLHIWHFLLFEPDLGLELYFVTYINNTSILLRCLTPNDFFPFNKNVNMSYLLNELIKNGFNHFILKVWDLLFNINNNNANFNQYHYISSTNDNSIKRLVHLLRAWNRIMYKDFKIHFPELIGYLLPGDYEMVKNFSKKLNNHFNHNFLTNLSIYSLQENVTNKEHFNNDEQCLESVNYWKRSHTKLYHSIDYQKKINLQQQINKQDYYDEDERSRKRQKR